MKILNVEKVSIDKVLANEEIKAMINAFGCGFSVGYGNDFDINKLKYHKIIIMADADKHQMSHYIRKNVMKTSRIAGKSLKPKMLQHNIETYVSVNAVERQKEIFRMAHAEIKAM